MILINIKRLAPRNAICHLLYISEFQRNENKEKIKGIFVFDAYEIYKDLTQWPRAGRK